MINAACLSLLYSLWDNSKLLIKKWTSEPRLREQDLFQFDYYFPRERSNSVSQFVSESEMESEVWLNIRVYIVVTFTEHDTKFLFYRNSDLRKTEGFYFK